MGGCAYNWRILSIMYSTGIRGSFLYIPIAELSTSLPKLRNMLTAIPKYKELASIQMFDESRPGYFGIPRYLYKNPDKLFTEIIEEVTEGCETEWYFLSKLWEHQKPLFDKFQKLKEEGKTGILLNARTGVGKTVLLLKFLSSIQRPALVIVPTTSLLTQWREMIKTHTSLTDNDIGHVQADHVDYIGKPISLGIVHSVCKNKYGAAFRNYFGILAVDEIHRCGCEHFSKVVSMFPAKYRIGCSGTMTRPDNMDIVFRNHIGEATIELGTQREEEVRPRVLVVRYQGASVNLPSWFKTLKVIQKRGVIISALATDKIRAGELVSYTLQVAATGRRVLVLADRINLLKYMRASIDKAHNTGLYISSTPAIEKERILKECNIIFATMGIFGLGMDIPDLAGLVFATPTARIAQPVGRILRMCKNKKRPVVLDMVDTDIRECVGWYRSREKEYKNPDIMGEIIQL